MVSQVSRMDQVVQSYVTEQQFMGSILVAQHGKILLDKGYGFANLEWQIPNSPTTKFRIASLTKQFTAVAILLLEERGKLKITDPLSEYMSDAPMAWNKVNIFHLLNHTSGIPNYTRFPNFAAFTTSAKTPEQQIAYFRDKPLEFEPGSNFEYSNSGYVLLGYLIEKITGQSYEDFMVSQIFKPLGMNDSGYDNNADVISSRASGYRVGESGIMNAEYLDMSIPYSAGSLYSTTHDLLRWQNALFGRKILSASSLDKILKPFMNHYGLGVIIQSLEGHQAVLHAGGTSGFNTYMIYSPVDELIIIVLANLFALGFVAQDLALKMIKLARGHAVILPSERIAVAVSSETLTEFVGTYHVNPYVGSYGLTELKRIEITLKNDGLMMHVENEPLIPLFAESPQFFYGKIPDIQIEFFKNTRGEVTHLLLQQDGECSSGERVR